MIESIIGSDIESIIDTYPKILEILQSIIRNIKNLETLEIKSAISFLFRLILLNSGKNFLVELVDELLTTYFESYHPFLFSILLFFGIIERKIVKVDETSTGRVNYSKQIIHYENLQYITHPQELRRRVYGWGTDKLILSFF